MATFRLGPGFDPQQAVGGFERGLGLAFRLRQARAQQRAQENQAFTQGIQTLGEIAGFPTAIQRQLVPQIAERFFPGGLGEQFAQTFVRMKEDERREYLGAIQLLGEQLGLDRAQIAALMREDFEGTTLRAMQTVNKFRTMQTAASIGGIVRGLGPTQGPTPAAAGPTTRPPARDVEAERLGIPPLRPEIQAPAESARLPADVMGPREAPLNADIERINRQLEALRPFAGTDAGRKARASLQAELTGLLAQQRRLFDQRQPTEAGLALRAEQGDLQAAGALARLREQRQASATQVNVGPSGIDYGDPPKGMTWARDAAGSVLTERDPKTGSFRPIAIPIRGSKRFQELEKAQQAQTITKQQARTTANIVTQDINRILGIIQTSEMPTVGPVGSLLARVPGTSAANLAALLDTIRANIGFDKLQQMRAASPTGGALGQVSERENILLQSTFGSLVQSQTQAQFVFNLKRIHDLFLDTVHGVGNGPSRLLSPQESRGTNKPGDPANVRQFIPGRAP